MSDVAATTETRPSSVRDTLEKVYAEAEKAAPAEKPVVSRETSVPEKPEKSAASEPAHDASTSAQHVSDAAPADRPRDQFGRFTSSSPSAVEAKAPPATLSDQAPTHGAELQQEPPSGAPPDAAIAPPQSWSADARADWSGLPRRVQDEILRRESATQDGFRQRAEQISALEPVAQAIAPYREKLAINGIHPAQAVAQLLAIQDMLDRDPLGGVAYVARRYGVDLHTFAQASEQAARANPLSPEMQEVRQELNGLKNYLQSQQQAVAQYEQTRINSEVQAFGADPAHPYFEKVRMDMGRLMQQGIAATLQDAYDRACWSNADIRAAMLERQREASNATRQAAEKKAAEAARRAGASISGNADGRPQPANGLRRAKSGETVRDTLRRNVEGLA